MLFSYDYSPCPSLTGRYHIIFFCYLRFYRKILVNRCSIYPSE
nr:MAG TPA: hypothetical protein [Caudoviricetes sp.]